MSTKKSVLQGGRGGKGNKTGERKMGSDFHTVAEVWGRNQNEKQALVSPQSTGYEEMHVVVTPWFQWAGV